MRGKFINFLFITSSQIIVLLLSILTTLVLPKITTKDDFGYWQFFLLIISFSGFLTVGFNDGFYLIYGGKKYDELPFKKISPKVYSFILLQFIFSILILLSSSLFLDEKRYIIQILAFYSLFQNINNLFSLIFQGGLRFKTYSYSVVIDKFFFLFLFLIFIFLGIKNYKPYMIAYTISKAIAMFYSIFMAKRFFTTQVNTLFRNIKYYYSDLYDISKVGISLMISNILGALIIGGSRFIIEQKWGIATFSEISLSYSLSMFLLIFISQISVILFPMIKTANNEKVEFFFIKGKQIISLFLPLILPLYSVVQFFLPLWLPQYEKSIKYLALLLPICIFDGKFQIIYNTFYKALRLEKKLLVVNLFSFVLSILLATFSAYVLDSVPFMIISLLLSIIFRTLLSEIIISKKMDNINHSDIYGEVLLSIVFIYCFWYLSGEKIGIIIFYIVLTIYYASHYKIITQLINKKTSL